MSVTEPNSVTLEELLTRYRESDPHAFSEFFSRTSKLVFNYLMMKLGNRIEAEEVMQDTYFRIHRYISSYDKDRNALAWIMSIARNALIDHVQGKRGARASEDILELQMASGLPGPDKQAELRQLAMQICEGLTLEERSILVDRVINDFSYDEIAEQRGISEENARQKISRLLKRLRASIS